MGSVGVSVASPICIHLTPQNVGVFARITRATNCLIPSAAKIAQNVFGSKHVILSWKLYILTELGICPSKVWAYHCDKIPQAMDNTTITSMEFRGRILVTVVFVEARVGLRECKARSGTPEILSAYNFLGVVGLGQIHGTFVHVTCHLTSKVMLQSPLIGALQSV